MNRRVSEQGSGFATVAAGQRQIEETPRLRQRLRSPFQLLTGLAGECESRLRVAVHRSRSLRRLLSPLIFAMKMLSRRRRLNAAFDALFENVMEGSLVVRVPHVDGQFEFDRRSRILRRIMIDGEYEPAFMEIVRKYIDPDRDALDVGANNGLFTVLMARLLGTGRRVLAVEPTPNALAYLRKNLLRNGCDNIVVFEGVAGNECGNALLNTIPGMEEFSSLRGDIAPVISGALPQTVQIRAVSRTLDSLVREHGLNPGFMKVDTEGAEFLVLSGAEELLSKARPVILAELVDAYLAGFGHSVGDVIALLKRFEYRVVNAASPDRPVTCPFSGEVLALPCEVSIAVK
jgi:FkbM family methyltransferase